MARKERKKILAFALETTYGTDAIAAGSPKYLLGREFSITPMAGESQSLDYDDGTLGNSPEIVTELYVTMEFTVDFAAAANATTAAPWSELMTACLRKTTTHTTAGGDAVDENLYEIDENGTGSMTFYYYQDGVLHKMTGARGSLSLSAEAKNFGGIKFTFTGLHQPVTDIVLPSADFSAWQTPLKIGVQHSAFTLGGQALKLISLEYDQANQVIYQEYVGHEEVLITDYQPTGTMVIEAPAKSVFDPFAIAKAGTELPLVFTNGSAGNQVEWKASRIQLGRPTYAEQDGTLTYSIPYTPISNTDTFATR